MRELWIKIAPSLPKDVKKKLIQSTLGFCSTYMVEPDDEKIVKLAGAKTVATSESGDILLVDNVDKIPSTKKSGKEICITMTIGSEYDVEKVVETTNSLVDYVVVRCLNWKVIPLENLIARSHGKSKLLAWVTSAEEAKLALEILEIGVDGVVGELSSLEELKKIHEELRKVKTRAEEKESVEKIILSSAKLIALKSLGSGARVCVDTCDLMKNGEGMLVGCQSSGLFLIQAEVYESQYVESRPFRINAGPPALYALMPEGKTKYLSEINAGDEVLIIDREGRTRTVYVCRVKIEWRPLILIEAECETKIIKTIVQNAETIRIVTEDGHKSVTELTPGDNVLVHIEEGGRHFGALVKKETVVER